MVKSSIFRHVGREDSSMEGGPGLLVTDQSELLTSTQPRICVLL